jgi:hypothetical protein
MGNWSFSSSARDTDADGGDDVDEEGALRSVGSARNLVDNFGGVVEGENAKALATVAHCKTRPTFIVVEDWPSVLHFSFIFSCCILSFKTKEKRR